MHLSGRGGLDDDDGRRAQLFFLLLRLGRRRSRCFGGLDHLAALRLQGRLLVHLVVVARMDSVRKGHSVNSLRGPLANEEKCGETLKRERLIVIRTKKQKERERIESKWKKRFKSLIDCTHFTTFSVTARRRQSPLLYTSVRPGVSGCGH